MFTGVQAPHTWGTFLRTFTLGHVRQFDAVASRFLINLAKNAPLLPGADQGVVTSLVFLPGGCSPRTWRWSSPSGCLLRWLATML